MSCGEGRVIGTQSQNPPDTFRHVFLVRNRTYWKACPFPYDAKSDLVLTCDFALLHMIQEAGGRAYYVDHAISSEILERYNYKTYEFLATWYCNACGEDIFRFRGIDAGSAFRMEIINDVTYYIRMFANIHELLKGMEYKKFYVGTDDSILIDIIDFLGIAAAKWSCDRAQKYHEYQFPIFRFMHESLHPSRFRYKIKVLVLRILDTIRNLFQRFRRPKETDRHVYVHRYHPTERILSELKKTRDVRVVREDFNSFMDIFREVHLPVFASSGGDFYRSKADEILERFKKEKCVTFFVDDIDIADRLCEIIVRRITPLLPTSLRTIDAIIRFFTERRLSLMVTIASIGLTNRLMQNYCKTKNIPIYLIINGFLGNAFSDESRDATWINSYGPSIKKEYFKEQANVICLGDPRMDQYATSRKKDRATPSGSPVIGIGASGFSNMDLNCYLAIEFEFLNDIMKACKRLINGGWGMDIILKIRPNGYIDQYRDFLDEYYPDMPVTLVDNVPIVSVYEKVDFLISFYSQTLFEASCLGIPVLYYKNDTQYLDPPFDGKSELVTAFTVDDLAQKMETFFKGDTMFDAFKDKRVLEKYMGPLDGENSRRNMDFIYSLI